MRGDDVQQEAMFGYLSPQVRVPQDHPLRPIMKMVNQALAEVTESSRPRMPGKDALPSPWRSCCAPYCCKSFTPSAASAC